jgi:hypothetical protein
VTRCKTLVAVLEQSAAEADGAGVEDDEGLGSEEEEEDEGRMSE